MNIGGVVLCGGQSRRMGRPKAWLPFGNEVMLQRVARILARVADPVLVVSAAGQPLPSLPDGVEVVQDEVPDQGPLRALASGLRQLSGRVEAVYASSCDVPLLKPEIVSYLAGLLDRFEAVAPEEDGRWHPLAAVYRVSVRPKAERLLDQGHLRLGMLLDLCRTRAVPVQDLRRVDEALQSLRNVNTPEDYADLLSRAGVPAAGR